MLSNSLLGLAKSSIHRNLFLLFTAFLLQLFLSDGSPVNKAAGSSNGGCPIGWLYDRRFCVARGEGTTDRAVAFYCASYGGIGIKGLCIIRAPYSTSSLLEMSSDESSDDDASTVDLSAGQHSAAGPLNGQSLLGSLGQQLQRRSGITSDSSSSSSSSNSRKRSSLDGGQNDGGLVGEEKSIDEQRCATGWIHYRSMCVYQPMSIKERCHHMDAVEFNGLCIKHAATKEHEKQGYISKTDKRICCCSHISAKSNGYGC